jgi:hypothetical protein
LITVILAVATALGIVHARQVAITRQRAIGDSIAAVQAKAAAERMRAPRAAGGAAAATPRGE